MENLVEGDEAVLASGGTRPVIWTGSRRVRPGSHRNPAETNPVRVMKGAFGDGLPIRDLILSPGHAVFVDGVLVPVGPLVNGATIVQEEVESVRYFHVELDAHDVILAEGLPCESYLDDANRETFANSPQHTALHGRLDPVSWEKACAPVVRNGEALTAIRARLHTRAEALGWVKSTEHGLMLEVADGARLAPVHATANRLWFAVPASAAVRPPQRRRTSAGCGAGSGDGRYLGVAVSEVRVDGELLDLTNDVFGPGFHELEQDTCTAWRWTDGRAQLALDSRPPRDGRDRRRHDHAPRPGHVPRPACASSKRAHSQNRRALFFSTVTLMGRSPILRCRAGGFWSACFNQRSKNVRCDRSRSSGRRAARGPRV